MHAALKPEQVVHSTCFNYLTYLEDSSARRRRSLRSPASELELDVQGSRKRDPDAPSGSDPAPPAGGPYREAPGYARRRRHSLAHLYAERSQQSGSWAKRDAGWAGHVPRSRPPAGRAGPRAGWA